MRVTTFRVIEYDDGRVEYDGLTDFVKYLIRLTARLNAAKRAGRLAREEEGKPAN